MVFFWVIHVIINLACLLSNDIFFPSMIRSFDDILLRQTFLKLSLSSYIGNMNPLLDEFLSPIVAPDELLKKLPPTRIMCAGLDPLRDTSYVFAYKLA